MVSSLLACFPLSLRGLEGANEISVGRLYTALLSLGRGQPCRSFHTFFHQRKCPLCMSSVLRSSSSGPLPISNGLDALPTPGFVCEAIQGRTKEQRREEGIGEEEEDFGLASVLRQRKERMAMAVTIQGRCSSKDDSESGEIQRCSEAPRG